MERVSYRVEGMSCGGCVSSVTKALAGLGSVAPEVSLEAGTATVDARVSEAEVRRAIEAAGFGFGGRVPPG